MLKSGLATLTGGTAAARTRRNPGRHRAHLQRRSCDHQPWPGGCRWIYTARCADCAEMSRRAAELRARYICGTRRFTRSLSDRPVNVCWRAWAASIWPTVPRM